MSYTDENAVLRARFETQWAALHPEIKVAWPNEKFDPPHDGSWIKFNIISGEGRTAGFGSPGDSLNRYTGIININVMTPLNFGMTVAPGLSDEVMGIYRGWIAPCGNGIIRCRSIDGTGPSSKSIGLVPEFKSTWWMHTVTVPFHRDNFE